MGAALTVIAAFAMCYALAPYVIGRLHRAGLLDTESRRSSHTGTIPRGGGLAVIAATAVVGAGSAAWIGDASTAMAALVGAVGFGILGFCDDIRSIEAPTRLSIQFALALVSVAALAQIGALDAPASVPALVWVLGAILWVVGFVNAFNFMDGINGISIGSAVVIASGVALVSLQSSGAVVGVALALVGGCLGFAPFNVFEGKVFLGDSGSYFIGSLLALLPLTVIADGGAPVALGLPFVIYLADVGYTLACRARRGECLWKSHREHVYQHLVHTVGWSHQRTAAVVSVLTLCFVVLGQIASFSGFMAAAMMAVAGVATACYLVLPQLLMRRSTQSQLIAIRKDHLRADPDDLPLLPPGGRRAANPTLRTRTEVA